MPVLIRDYPKWITRNNKQVLVQCEDDEIELDNKEEKDHMVKTLKKDYGKDVDLRTYKGTNGFGSLKAYYEAVISRESKDKD
jgi:hypothetical protein